MKTITNTELDNLIVANTRHDLNGNCYPVFQALTELKALRHPAPCVWTEDEDNNWSASCGAMHTFLTGNPGENHHRFCPYCGKPLTINPIEAKAKVDEVKPVCCCIPESLCSTPAQCKSTHNGWCCTRKARHEGDHVACVIGNEKAHREMVWPNEAAKTPALISVAGAGAARLVDADIATHAQMPKSCGNCIGRFDSSKCRPAVTEGVCANKDEYRPKVPDVEPLTTTGCLIDVERKVDELVKAVNALNKGMK